MRKKTEFFDPEEYRLFEKATLSEGKLAAGADAIGMTYAQARFRGYTSYFRKKHPDYKVGKQRHKIPADYVATYLNKNRVLETDCELVAKVKSASSRKFKLNMIA